VNTINVSPTNLLSYWLQINQAERIKPGIATRTGRRAAGNTIFADYKSTDVALILDTTSDSYRVGSTGTWPSGIARGQVAGFAVI
jgi:hypothetical protein